MDAFNIESVREFCLSLPLTTEDMAFGEDHLLFRLFNKIFGCLSLDGDAYLTLKCDPEYALELRENYSAIAPAYHWNKKYWNQLHLDGSINNEMIKGLIRHSYLEIVAKLPKKLKTEHPEIILSAE